MYIVVAVYPQAEFLKPKPRANIPEPTVTVKTAEVTDSYLQAVRNKNFLELQNNMTANKNLLC